MRWRATGAGGACAGSGGERRRARPHHAPRRLTSKALVNLDLGLGPGEALEAGVALDGRKPGVSDGLRGGGGLAAPRLAVLGRHAAAAGAVEGAVWHCSHACNRQVGGERCLGGRSAAHAPCWPPALCGGVGGGCAGHPGRALAFTQLAACMLPCSWNWGPAHWRAAPGTPSFQHTHRQDTPPGGQ